MKKAGIKRIFASFLLIPALFALFACGGGGEETVSDEAVSPAESEAAGISEESASGGSRDINPYPYLGDLETECLPDGVYRIGEFSITLPEEFRYQPVDDFALYASDSENAAVVVSLESFSDLYSMSMDVGMSPCEYAKKIISESGGVKTPVYDRGDTAYFEYVKDL